MIPKQLQRPEFRFVKIKAREKGPFEYDWQNTKNYPFSEFRWSENYGVVCGVGDLTVIDSDVQDVVQLVENTLPATFTVRTGRGGTHSYYFCKDLEKTYRFRKEAAGDVGDLKRSGQVVGPGSIHPNGKRYEVVKDLPIAEISQKQLLGALGSLLIKREEIIVKKMPFIPSEKTGYPTLDKLRIEDFLDMKKLKARGGENQGAHPIHGSEGGGNFSVNSSLGIWHCFRCSSGGGTLQWIAVKEGIIDCKDAAPGVLRGEKFNQLLEVLKTKHGVVEQKPRYSKYIKKVDGKKVFQYELLVDDILGENRYATDTKSENVYIYSSGVWSRLGVIPTLKQRSAYLTQQKLSSHQFNELVFHLKNKTFISGDVFDKNPYLVNCQNGVYDLEEREFREHRAEDYLTAQIPIVYDPNAKADDFNSFIKEITASVGDISVVQKIFGYCLVKHSKEQKFFIWEGDGANGKSVLLGMVRAMLGEHNVVALTLNEIEKNRFARARLFEKLANLCGDLSFFELAFLGTIKRLTGEDSISAETKGKDGFDFISYAKPVFLANKIPKMGEDTHGVWRRIVLTNFPHKFDSEKDCLFCSTRHNIDKNMATKLKKELPGILNWAIRGYDLLQEFSFKPVDRITYLKKSDPLKLFCEEKIIDDPKKWVLKTDLYAAYVNYCLGLSMSPMSDNKFWKEILKQGRMLDIRRVYELDGNPRAWFGIKLNQGIQPIQGFTHHSQITEVDKYKGGKGKTLDSLDSLDATPKTTTTRKKEVTKVTDPNPEYFNFKVLEEIQKRKLVPTREIESWPMEKQQTVNQLLEEGELYQDGNYIKSKYGVKT